MRLLLIPVLVLCLASPVRAGEIRGSVKVPPAPAAEPSFHAYAGRASSLPAPAHVAKGLVTDAVLYVDALPSGVARGAPRERPQLAQRGQAFDPRVVVVAAGDAVDFPNFDPVYHNVFSVSPTRRFDLGKYPRGQSRTVVFPKPGLVNVFCDIHADMAAFVLVVPTRAWSRPGADGRYAIAGLPPGRYHLRWWHPDFAGGETDVDVPRHGDATWDVSF